MADDDSAGPRARLAAMEARLAQLRAQYDLLMNRFEFDAARALVSRIEAAERDLAALLGDLPARPVAQPAPYAVARRRRRRR